MVSHLVVRQVKAQVAAHDVNGICHRVRIVERLAHSHEDLTEVLASNGTAWTMLNHAQIRLVQSSHVPGMQNAAKNAHHITKCARSN
jgi:predicted TPR repeat methyltransferase